MKQSILFSILTEINYIEPSAENKQRIDHRRWTEIQAIAKQKPEKRLSTNNFNLHGSMANLFLDLFSG